MSDFTYFRIGVPNDMVADIMWHDDFEVSIESYSKHETNYQRYFGTESKTAMMLSDLCQAIRSCAACPFFNEQEGTCPFGNDPALAEKWLESEAE